MKNFLLGFLFGGIACVLLYHFRGWILAKIGVNFPPKPPSAP